MCAMGVCGAHLAHIVPREATAFHMRKSSRLTAIAAIATATAIAAIAIAWELQRSARPTSHKGVGDVAVAENGGRESKVMRL